VFALVPDWAVDVVEGRVLEVLIGLRASPELDALYG